MKPGHGIADALRLLKTAITPRRLVLPGLIVSSAISLLVATPAAARADCALTTIAAPLVFTELNESKTLIATACDQFIEDNNTWGGLFTSNLGDAYNYFGLGVSPYNGQPMAQQFSTANATYEFTGTLSTDSYAIKLISRAAAAARADTITLYTCETAENPTNANGCPTTRVTTIAVSLDLGEPVITTDTLADATSGTAYSATVAVTSPFPINNFTIQAGSLPPGLSLSNAGVISGTPTSSGTFNFTVRVEDSVGQTADKAFTITVATPTLTITPSTLDQVVAGAVVSQALTTTGGLAPYSYAITAGAAPDGITLSTGTLAGTPTTSGTFNFTVTATDSTGGTAATASTAYAWTVAVPTLMLAPATLPAATAGAAYSQTLTTSGGNAPYSYSYTGTLPPGLSLVAGTLSGTPTATGTYNLSVTVTDSTGSTAGSTTKSYALTVAAPTITLSPASLADVTRGDVPTTTFTASGGVAPYTFTVGTGLPPGISLSANGQLTGQFEASGTFTFTITAQDSTSGNGPYSGQTAYTLVVDTPEILLSTIGTGTAYAAYTATITASGGNGPYSFTRTAGSLPTGLTLFSDGTLSGTPLEPGTFNFTVQATDASTADSGGPYSGTQTYAMVIAAPVVSLPATSLPSGSVNALYNAPLNPATGGLAPYRYAVTGGALPGGLTLSPSGVLSGRPDTIGTFTFTVTATDASTSSGPYSASQIYQLTIDSAPPAPIPTMMEWAMLLLALLIAGCGAIILNRRSAVR